MQEEARIRIARCKEGKEEKWEGVMPKRGTTEQISEQLQAVLLRDEVRQGQGIRMDG
ncbi:hypothetical protein CMEL01_08796 [Colletotrichum melonis]|uniref:Uncharacterized protein n=1 Tax=Colletotrichum melonis TaxID=1209925 RepID=A0AAI9U4Q4_9PEZI|nr:hypothetical protein CMEL01_08796 [Colletotrichum melonis]